MHEATPSPIHTPSWSSA